MSRSRYGARRRGIRRGSWQRSTASLAALLATANVGISTGSASAAQPRYTASQVVAPCGTTLATPPTTIGQGIAESNSLVRVYSERRDYSLPQYVPVDVTPPRSYPKAVQAPADLTPSIIPRGTAVDSYMAISDPVGQPRISIFYQLTLTFTTPILGVILQSPTLDRTDATVGSPATTYLQESSRGLELNHSDNIVVDSPYSVTLHFLTNTDTDQVRVITAATPPAGQGTAPSSPTCTTAQYTEVASDGGIFTFGSPFFGSTGNVALNKPMVSGSQDAITGGYWEVASDGGIFDFGAPFFGSLGSTHLNKPIVAMVANPTGLGYRLFASDGGVFTFGDAFFKGSLGDKHLNKPIVGAASVPHSTGYWMVASDGGIFDFGNAGFYGSTGAVVLNKPIVGMAATPTGHGYWLVASDGGVFDFGDAAFYGSTGNIHLNAPIVAIKSSLSGKGYWLFAADGGVFNFGDATFLGSTGNIHLNKPIVGAF